MYYNRDLNIIKILEKKSVFLFGPRGTGKSSLLRDQLGQKASLINLLKSSEFLRLSQNPSLLEDMIESFGKPWVVIDEIQKLPLLLDEVHRLIETKKYKFVLTGSSARKLKRGGANLLAGRAWQSDMLPLTSHEISDFRLDRYLRYGGLPAVYTSKDPIEELDAYVNTYLYEEIQAEGLVRKLANFSRFLKTAAMLSGQLINYQNIANDSSVKVSTVKDYLQILNDTLVGFLVEPWLGSKKRKAIATAKFYFFDIGVTHAINGTKSLDRNSNLYGQSFEHFIAQELRAYISYKRLKSPLLFWRSTSQFEVDFLLNEEVAIEVKATQKVNPDHIKGLKALQGEKKLRRFILVSQDKIQTKSGGIESLHWENFLKKLWNDELV